MDTLPFKFIWLGQTICRYQVPMDIFIVLNKIYEENFINLPDAHTQLVGKISKENSLFFGGADNNKMHKHNLLPPYVLKWFESVFKHYLDFNKIKDLGFNAKRSINDSNEWNEIIQYYKKYQKPQT